MAQNGLLIDRKLTHNHNNIKEHEFDKDSTKLVITTLKNMNLTKIYQK